MLVLLSLLLVCSWFVNVWCGAGRLGVRLFANHVGVMWKHSMADDPYLMMAFFDFDPLRTSPGLSYESHTGYWADLCIPIWLPMIALLAIVVGLRSRGGQGAEYPICVQCGYNLTGCVSGRCPECGTPIAQDSDRPDD